MTGQRRWRQPGWLVLATVATLMAVVGVSDALAHGDFVGLVTLPLGLLFWYWVGVGAWRRAVQHA